VLVQRSTSLTGVRDLAHGVEGFIRIKLLIPHFSKVGQGGGFVFLGRNNKICVNQYSPLNPCAMKNEL